MNRDFCKGLATGLILTGTIGGVAHFTIVALDKKLNRYRKTLKILSNVAEALEQHVDPDLVKQIIDAQEFDVMILKEFGQ